LRITARALGASRWRCCTTTMGTGNSAGSPDRNAVSAFRPPAEAATATSESVAALSAGTASMVHATAALWGGVACGAGPAAPRLAERITRPVHHPGGSTGDEIAWRGGRRMGMRMGGRDLLRRRHQVA